MTFINVDKFIEQETEIINGLSDNGNKNIAWAFMNDLRNFAREDIVCPHCGKVVNDNESAE